MSTKNSTRRRPRHVTWAACLVTFTSTFASAAFADLDQSQAIRKIERYCSKSWRNAGIHVQDWPDCTQQVLTELWDGRPSTSFAVYLAKPESPEKTELRQAVQRIVQRWRRASQRWYQLDGTEVLDSRGSRTLTLKNAWRDVVEVAELYLRPDQRTIIELSFEGWEAGEIAEQFDLPANRVYDRKHKAIRKLRKHFDADSAIA